MAFIPVKSLDGAAPPFEYRLMTDGEAVTLGEALVETSGRLTKCGATVTPEFIAMKTQAAETTSVTPVPVIRVTETREFKAVSTATVAASLVGSKVTISSDGLFCTATTTSGVFMITQTDGKTTNSNVRGMFRR